MGTLRDVVVVGAGMAGLCAAYRLAEAGLNVVLLEAQHRVGGRILSLHEDGETLELGAEFIHGRPPELWTLVEEAGLETYELEGDELCFDGRCRLSPCGKEQERAFEFLDTLKDWKGDDQPFAHYASASDLSAEDRQAVLGYVEGFNAADAEEISSQSLGVQQAAEEAIEGDRLFRVRGGYDQLPSYLAQRFQTAGGSLELGSVVDSLAWSREQVKLTARQAGHETTIEARRAILALPLPLLQQRRVRMHPEPESLSLLEGLRMGQVLRFTLLFRRPFWQEEEATRRLSFLHADSELPAVWWTAHPEGRRTLTGWIGGPRIAGVDFQDEWSLGRTACQTLARIFQKEPQALVRELVACHMHDWQTDPFSGGAYSYVRAGFLQASRGLAEPVENTIYFAGEHTDTTGHWGTVHAAIGSGYRAAHQLLTSW